MLGGRVEMVGQRLTGRGRKGAQLRERLLRRASSCRVPLGELIQPVSGTPCRSNSEEARPQITWACATYSSAAELMRCPALSATVADPEVFIDTGADVSLNEERRASTPASRSRATTAPPMSHVTRVRIAQFYARCVQRTSVWISRVCSKAARDQRTRASAIRSHERRRLRSSTSADRRERARVARSLVAQL